MAKEKLNIGTKLYRAIPIGGIFEFTITGARERAKSIHYEIQSDSCRDHTPCELLIGYDDYGKLTHIEMLNEDEDFVEKHRMWHNEAQAYFYLEKKDAERERAKKHLCKAQEAVKQKEIQLDNARKHLQEIEDIMALLTTEAMPRNGE